MNPCIAFRVLLVATILATGTSRAEDAAPKPAPAPASSPAPAATAPTDAQAAADKIAAEVEQLRGLKFKQPVRAETQSMESFGEFISGELDREVPESLRAHYGLIVRALGLYRGPLIEDFSAMMTTVMTSQVGAYYDPRKKSFFVLMGNMPEIMQGVLYSHELYHALQDQYFELERYTARDSGAKAWLRNSDADLARRALIEGEATYMMSMWMVQKMSGKPPTRKVMDMVAAQTVNVGLDELRAALKKPGVEEALGPDLKNSVEAANEIPAFIMETMMGVYFKGMGFVHVVHEKGWPAVETAYTGYAPQSTEQILHPEKWLAQEDPAVFEWPKLDKVRALRGWQLMDDDVLGEFQMRIIFREQGLTQEAVSAAAGWGGDRYAVFKRKDSDATLLLLRSAWDSEAEAKEFADAWRRVQAGKFGDSPVPVRVEQKGTDVFIVEGGDAGKIDSLLKVVRKVKPRKG
jgi:hypothetical protein